MDSSCHTPKERHLPELQNHQPYQHLSVVMLNIILNKIQPQAEEIIGEEQAGFRAGRSTTEQILAASAESLPCLHRLQEGL